MHNLALSRLALVTLLLGPSLALAADKPPPTLAGRLAAYQHVEVDFGTDVTSATLRLYTAAQQERNLKARAEATKEQAASTERANQLRARVNAAPPGEERDRLREEYDQLVRGRFVGGRGARRGNYYTIVSVGDDYVELKSTDGNEAISLLPLRLVGRVHLPEKDEPAQPEAAKPEPTKAEPKP